MATDTERVNLLPGMLGQAAKSKLTRRQVIDKAVDEAVGHEASEEEPPKKGGMSQADFSWGKEESEESKAKKAKGLANLLRKR